MAQPVVARRVEWRLFGRRVEPFRVTVAVGFVALAAVAWAATFFVGDMSTVAMMGPDVPMLLAFIGVWVVGMVAMMFPVMIPVVLAYDRVQRASNPFDPKPAERNRSWRAVAMSLFLSGYLAMYALLGVGVLLVFLASPWLMMAFPPLTDIAWGIPIAAFAMAGVYQLSPIKQRCLATLHSPLALFVKGWRGDLSGAAMMGARHGLYCVGCCWMYMIVLAVVGSMGLFWMAGFAFVLSIEKASGHWGVAFSKVVAVGLLGVAVILATRTLLAV